MAVKEKDTFHDVMVDLETTGQGPGCAILSIGAVAMNFRRGTLSHKYEFYKQVKLSSCLKYGLATDPETMLWWSKQTAEASEVLSTSETHGLTLPAALKAFRTYLLKLDPTLGNIKIWGNGADFDNAILQHTYKLCGYDVPWKFWNGRCYRTLKSLAPSVKFARIGTHHNALGDARTQAVHALDLMRALNL